MLRNYILVAIRHVWKDKFYTFLNIFGLAIGITCFILILLFIRDELSYEKKFSKHDKTYRVCEIIASPGGGENSASVPIPMKRTLLNDYPDLIENAVRLFNFQSSKFVLEIGDETYIEKKLFFVDSSFFEIFDYPVVKGNLDKALSDPFSVVLTVEAAKKYFGDQDPIGKEMRGQGQDQSSTVRAVIDPSGINTHLDFNVLVPIYPALREWTLDNYYWNPAWTYIVLKDGVDPKELESRFPELVKKYFPDHIIDVSTMYLMPLDDIHLKSNLDFEMHPNSDITYVYIFAVIAFLVLVISCTNFINLATARTANRSKEVGMRKVMGAHKGQLVSQFLGETIFQSFVALLIGIIFAELLLNTFNSFSGKSFNHDFVLDPFMIFSFIGIGLITGIISGIYPAFYLSSFRPSKVLKGGISLSMRKFGFRQVLVVLQFSISIILIIGTIVAFQQLRYLQKANLGFDEEKVLVVPFNNGLPIARWDAMYQEFVDHPSISNMSGTSHVMGSGHQTDSYRFEGSQENLQIAFINYSENFAGTFGVELLAGRDFLKEFRGDTLYTPGIVNEAFVQKLGLKSPEDAINKKLYKTQDRTVKIVGVTKNFHFASLHHDVTPIVVEGPRVTRFGMGANYLTVRFDGKDFEGVKSHTKKVLADFFPHTPYEYFFLEDNLDRLYETENIMSKVITTFSIFAIVVACMGLLGLTAFAAEQRTKELGIRKVLGATEENIIVLLSKEFVTLVLVAVAISIPISWYGLNAWLNDFAYRVDIQWWIFPIAGLVALMVAITTVGIQAYKAATLNPIDSISYE